MSVSTVSIPGSMAQGAGGVSWSNINNAKVEDGVVATSGLIGPGGGGGLANQLNGTNFGFSLPSAAIIDGIKLEIKVDGGAGNNDTGRINLLYNGGNTNPANTPNIGQNWFHSGILTWQSYGDESALWGRAWTPADINHANFGASIATQLNTGTGTVTVDAIRITVYYHIGGSTTPADVPIRELYKVYNQKGQYLGLLPGATDPLKIGQDINSLGSQISITVPVSADTSNLPSEAYTTEDGTANYTNEAATSDYTTEGIAPIVSAGFQGIDSLIKNGNTVEAWVYSYFYPNGKCMFIGKIRRWEASFGDDDNCVKVLLYSTSYDMDNYVARGAPFAYTTDVSQLLWNTLGVLSNSDKGAMWNFYGQTFKIGTGVTNIGAISLGLYGVGTVTVNIYDRPNGTLLGTVTRDIVESYANTVVFGFPSLIPVVAGQNYFFEVQVAPGQTISLCYQNSDVYADGTAWQSNYGGGGGGFYSTINADLYFITGSGTPSTVVTFTSKDPSTEMLAPILTDYKLRGGSQVWTAISIDATGLSLTYTFSVQTIYEALQAILSLAPNGFYYYVDLGTQTVYFKNQSTTAEFLLQKGVHINDLTLITSTESSVNQVLFTGGEVSPGVNLYKIYNDQLSQSAFGILLDRKTDNRVTQNNTANAVGVSELAEFSGEKYQTTVTLVHTTRLDITKLVPGKVVGFRGFGTFVDNILAVIVHRDWQAESVTLTLGILPTRLTYDYEQTTRQLIAEQTQNNPGTPT